MELLVTNASDNAVHKPAAAMRDCKKNNWIDSGLMPKKEMFRRPTLRLRSPSSLG
jgi:hypothetical protein